MTGRDRVAEVLAALPIGRRMWAAADGRSMWPVLLAGDRLRVLRCAAADLEPGDVAVLRYGDALLVAHLVKSTAPLVTCGITGVVDPPGGVVLGRVDALRRAGVRVPIPRLSQLVLRRVPGIADALKHSRTLRRLVQRLRDGR